MLDQYSARCPECGEIIELDSYNEVNDEIQCYNCNAELEIVGLYPPKLRPVAKSSGSEIEDEEGLDDLDNEENEERKE